MKLNVKFITEDLADLDLMKNLLYLLPPISERVNGKMRRATMAEGQDSFIQIVSKSEDVTAVLDENVALASKNGRTLQPRIMVIKDGDKIVSRVVINKTVYKVPTVLKALDVSFKAHMVLNALYSSETHNVYSFIQSHVFSISTDYDKITPTVASLHQSLMKE